MTIRVRTLDEVLPPELLRPSPPTPLAAPEPQPSTPQIKKYDAGKRIAELKLTTGTKPS